jgi:CheY-like chemotaxis protein
MHSERNILVVEDDQDIRETLHDLLARAGYNALLARDGREALDTLAKIKRPCMILLDLMMPVMDGWAFLRALDQDESLASIPIVILSAYTEKTKPHERVKGVLGKPVNVAALLRTVREHCGPPADQ